jgi:ankyrin repeat protein
VSSLMEAVLRAEILGVKQALTSGSDPNEEDCGMTPLLWAIFGGYNEVVRLLLDSGADPNLQPRLSGSSLWHAEDDFGLVEIIQLLKSYGATK